MNKICLLILIFAVCLLFVAETKSQAYTAGDQISLQVNNLSLIQTTGGPVVLSLTTATAGMPIASSSNSSLYIKLTSHNPSGTSRRVMAKIISGTVPSGTRLSLIASPCTTGGGNRGSVSSAITVSLTDQNIISGIGSCYTGSGTNDGYLLTYTWATFNPITNYGLIKASHNPTILSVLLTFSE